MDFEILILDTINSTLKEVKENKTEFEIKEKMYIKDFNKRLLFNLTDILRNTNCKTNDKKVQFINYISSKKYMKHYENDLYLSNNILEVVTMFIKLFKQYI